MANSDIKLKHKVQLRKKVEERDTTPSPNKPKSKAWLWIILGLIVLGVIGYLFFSKSGDTVAEPSEQKIEAAVESPVLTDSITAEKADIKEVVPINTNEVGNTTETKTSETVETPTIVDNKSNVLSSTPVISNDVEAEAMKVIRGDYGVGQERKDKLGNKYQSIQSRVNELKREGIF